MGAQPAAVGPSIWNGVWGCLWKRWDLAVGGDKARHWGWGMLVTPNL